MNINRLRQIIAIGEGINIEFKRTKNKLNKNIFESVCAFLNRNGGHILLGVEDNGDISGVDEKYVSQIINSFITTLNNPQKLFPTYYLAPEVFDFYGKQVIYIFVPESSTVHNTTGKTFDRNDDGDLNVTGDSFHISNLYQRKQRAYSENILFPYAEFKDLRSDLIERVRIRAKNENGGSHPWFEMNDKELLRSAQVYKQDLKTGEEGLTLAGILLFGTDELILNAVSYHKADAILRKYNCDRYDDRDDIRTNLIESYDRLMAFVVKHLPDPFYLENDTRISVRNKIFREAVSNILIHREFLNPFPAKMIIEKDRVVFENANRPHGYGQIDPNTFTPFPKNPIIARVFKEIGFADELGSGVKNLYNYCKIYSNTDPQLIEGDVFKIIIPTYKTSTYNVASPYCNVSEGISEGVSEGVSEKIIKKEHLKVRKDRQKKLAFLLKTISNNQGKRVPYFISLTKMSQSSIERCIKQLKSSGLIYFAHKPSNKTGGYYLTEKIKAKINNA